MAKPQAQRAGASHNISKAHLITNLREQEQLRNKYASALDFLGVDPTQAEVPLVFLAHISHMTKKLSQ